MSPSAEVRLFIVIPVYGNWVDTLATLKALEVQDTAAFRVLIADDGSKEPAPPEIHQFPFAEYDKQPNAGFGGNCNRAARRVIAQGATHILFLNNDTEFSPQFVSSWLRTIAQHPDAIISPNIYWFSQPQSVWYSGGKMSVLTPFVRLAHEFRETTPVDIICGCAMLVPVDAWNRLGGFDERFVVYFEDFDLCVRAKQANIPVLVAAAPELRVWHKVSGSFRGDRAWNQQYFLLASRLRFIRLHFRTPARLLCYALTIPHLMVMCVNSLPAKPNLRRLWAAAAQGLAE
jgi:GT2 family glycosyltransferase